MALLMLILSAIGIILELITILQRRTDVIGTQAARKLAELLRHCEHLKSEANRLGIEPENQEEAV